MLKQRIITALILVSVLLSALFFLPKPYFQYLIIAVFTLAAWEWANLAGIQQMSGRVVYALLAAVALYMVVNSSSLPQPFYGDDYAGLVRDILGVACLWWALALLWVKSYPASTMIWQHPAIRAVMGFVVLLPAALALIYAHSQNNGHWFFLYLVGIVVFADIGAYFSGKRWGKKKLAPAVSPGKSWAGFFGGVVSVAIFASVVASMYQVMGLTAVQLIVVTVISALASVLGDLLESMLKRHRGIKDSSQLLPGHGGILDRIDSVCAAAPVFVLLSMLL